MHNFVIFKHLNMYNNWVWNHLSSTSEAKQLLEFTLIPQAEETSVLYLRCCWKDEYCNGIMKSVTINMLVDEALDILNLYINIDC